MKKELTNELPEKVKSALPDDVMLEEANKSTNLTDEELDKVAGGMVKSSKILSAKIGKETTVGSIDD